MPNTQHNEMRVYWENVCVLKKMEKEKMNLGAERWLAEKGNAVHFHYFGMGELMGIDEKIKNDLETGSLASDMVVSAKVDIFYDQNLLLGELDSLQALKGRFPLRPELQKLDIVRPGGYFHPCGVLAVILIANSNLLNEDEMPGSWEDLLESRWEGKLVCGGIDKPVGTAFMLGMWNMYGTEGLSKCLQNSRIVSAPAAALNAVSRGEFSLGVVPLIFAGRKGIGNIVDIWPREGAIAIPSYVAIRSGADDSAVDFIERNLFSPEIQEFYSQRGIVIPALAEVKAPQEVIDNNFHLTFPGWPWIEKMDMNEFRKLCRQAKYV